MPREERDALNKAVSVMDDETIALAGFAHRYFSEENLAKINTAVGAGATAATTRLDNFERALVNYQRELTNLWQLSRNNRHGRGPAAARTSARVKVRKAYAVLQNSFTQELNRYAPAYLRAKNRGDALSNAERGITLATRKPNSPKMDPRIQVANRYEAGQLAHLGKLLKVLGNAAVLADAGFRIKEVVDTREEGGDWLRESTRQMSGFGTGGAAGIAIGTAVVKVGTTLASSAGAAGLVAAGPVGWAILGAIIVVGLGAGLAAGYYGDIVGKRAADKAWELSSGIGF